MTSLFSRGEKPILKPQVIQARQFRLRRDSDLDNVLVPHVQRRAGVDVDGGQLRPARKAPVSTRSSDFSKPVQRLRCMFIWRSPGICELRLLVRARKLRKPLRNSSRLHRPAR